MASQRKGRALRTEGPLAHNSQHQRPFDDPLLDRVVFLIGGVVDESRQSDLKLYFREGDFGRLSKTCVMTAGCLETGGILMLDNTIAAC